MATAHETVPAQQVVDPVCGMTIDPADAVGHAEYEGKTYYFCSDSCLTQFRADPAQFVEPDRTSAPSAAEPDVGWPADGRDRARSSLAPTRSNGSLFL
jgi:YHS domain-containing protein